MTIAPAASAPASPPSADFFGSDPERLKDLVARAGELVRRAILTDAVLPDRDRPRGYASTIPSMSPADRIAAFGFETAIAIDEETREIQRRRASRFKPSRSDIEHFIEILSWLSWLKRQDEEGADGVRIIRLRAFQVAAWSIGQRLGVSDDTIRRRHLAAVTRIAARYWQRIEAFG